MTSIRDSHNDAPPTGVSNGIGFVAQLRPALIKYFRRKTGNPVEAEDLAQDVIVRALTHANWKTQEEAKGYIFRSAVNRWRDRYRRLQTHGVNVDWDDESAFELDAENSPERVLIGEEELNRVLDGLRALSPRARNVLMLVKLENMKISSVATALGISVRTVNYDLASAMAQLARLRRP